MSSVASSADRNFCQEFAQSAIKHYWLVEENPAYDCHTNHPRSPQWSPDPEIHFRWCISDSVHKSVAENRLEEQEAYIRKHCW